MENIELYELYHNLFLGCLIACIALAAVAVLLFFVLDIRGVIGYLTGRAAKRQIQKIEEESAASGRLYRKTRRNQQYEEEKQSGESGISPAAMPGARKVDHAVQSAHSAEIARREQQRQTEGQQPARQGVRAEQPVRQSLENRSLPPQAELSDSVGTTLLSDSGETELIVPTDAGTAGTTLLEDAGGTETTVLADAGAAGTTLLAGTDETETTVPEGSGDVGMTVPADTGETEIIVPSDAGAAAESLEGATEQMEGEPPDGDMTIYGYSVRRKTTGTFKIEQEIVMIHSKEII
ncbi:MAG: hypothetical protein LIO75_05710 [Lachnospiraceae bacterium]|nr:hypothetical protein [Lachnospiraceae bacterium]